MNPVNSGFDCHTSQSKIRLMIIKRRFIAVFSLQIIFTLMVANTLWAAGSYDELTPEQDRDEFSYDDSRDKPWREDVIKELKQAGVENAVRIGEVISGDRPFLRII